jgi:hypothetical protein
MPRGKGTIPSEWVAEAWLSSGSWVQKELFPCQICYGFHGTDERLGGPAHLVPDHREPVVCPECQGMGRRTCLSCKGQAGVVCDECKGFGIVDCPECDLVRIRDIVVAKASRDDKIVPAGDEGETIHKPNLDHVKVPDRGEIRYTSLDPCRNCRSRGWLDCPYCREGFRPCRSCRGAGFDRGPCSVCRGAGVIWPRKIKFKLRRVRKRTPLARR